ncbi:MAG: hypothetical protein KA426_16100 [Nitrospira sp.]|nr:hypothetical protein [Nitrospira sp.]
MTSQRRPLIEAEVEHLVATGLSQRPYDPGLRRDWRLLVAVLVGVSAFFDTFYRSCVAPLLFVIVIAVDYRSSGTLLGGRRRATGAPPP